MHLLSSSLSHFAAENSDAAILDNEIKVTYSGNKLGGSWGPDVSAPPAQSHVYTREKPSSFLFKPLLSWVFVTAEPNRT